MDFAVIGLGSRGSLYASIIKEKYPDCKIVAVCDVEEYRLKVAKEKYGISDDMLFTNEDDFFAKGKLADALIIGTIDKAHYKEAIRAMEVGYDMIMEKPMSPDQEECKEIVATAKKFGRKIAICHVLRYTPFYSEIKKIIERGDIGTVVTMSQTENVAYWHQAHSFVRGNWHNSKESSPMILQKCCHDLDIIRWLMDKSCLFVSSFGSLMHFNKENAPEGSAENCLDCKLDCIYNSAKWYKTKEGSGWFPGKKHGIDDVDEAMRVLPYGKCVYKCDNDVVDHQVVNMLFEDGATAQLTMTAFSQRNYRELHIHGTKGEIIGDMENKYFDVTIFGKGTERVDITKLGIDLSGHGGGDIQLVKEFIEYVNGNCQARSSATASLESHLMAFAAEQSRLEGGKVIPIITE